MRATEIDSPWRAVNDTRPGNKAAVWFLYRRINGRTEYVLGSRGQIRTWRTKGGAEAAIPEEKPDHGPLCFGPCCLPLGPKDPDPADDPHTEETLKGGDH